MFGRIRRGDRRKHKRYRCGGNVQVRSLNYGKLSLGKIVDISSGGCLLRLDGRSNFTTNDMVEVIFRSSYLAFRIVGAIRRCEEEGTLIGLQFRDVSERGRRDLQGLMKDMQEAEQGTKAKGGNRASQR